MILNSQIMKYGFHINFTQLTEIITHVLKRKYLKTSKHLKMKVLCSFRTWGLIMQSCSIVSQKKQTLNHTTVKTS